MMDYWHEAHPIGLFDEIITAYAVVYAAAATLVGAFVWLAWWALV